MSIRQDAIDKITPLDEASMRQSRENWNVIAKPLGSLGLLEDAVTRICGIQGTARPSLQKRAVAVFCGDHGVAGNGVTQSPQSVTVAVAQNMAAGKAAVNALASIAGCDVLVIDAGIAEPVDYYRIQNRKVAKGTNDFTQGPAMTAREMEQALEAGVVTAQQLKREGYTLLAAGEMGVGNTTSASAMAAVLLQKPPEEVTGRGSGLSDEGLIRKIAAVGQAIKINKDMFDTPFGVLQALGGHEIAAMTGFFIGSASCGLPCLIDGVISSVSALAAIQIAPRVKDYLFASHVSSEPAGKLLVEALGLNPYIDCRMRLGEGGGAVMAMSLIDHAMAVYNHSASFLESSIKQYEQY